MVWQQLERRQEGELVQVVADFEPSLVEGPIELLPALDQVVQPS